MLTFRARHVEHAIEETVSAHDSSARRQREICNAPFAGRLRDLLWPWTVSSEGAKSREISIQLVQTCEGIRTVMSEEGGLPACRWDASVRRFLAVMLGTSPFGFSGLGRIEFSDT
jgi:hypothetical protein